MARKSFFGMGIGILILIAILALGSGLVYRTGWSNGYATGIIAAASAQDGAMAPISPLYQGMMPATGGSHGGVAIFLIVVLGLLAFGFVGKMFRARAWYGMAGHGGSKGPAAGSHWSPHHREHPGPWVPWCWYEAYEEKPEESKPEGQSEEAEK